MTNHTTPVSVGGAFRKKPIVVEAFCLDGGPMPDWFLDARSADVVQTFSQGTGNPFDDPLKFAYIHTLEGVMRAERGDWIIRGIKGEMYPCKPDIFEVTYEPAALPPPPQGEGKQQGDLPVELRGIAATLDEGQGFWRSCSGCYETEDGHPVGRYPQSAVMRCPLGGGCSECGGIGAVWDDTDYDELAEHMAGNRPGSGGDAKAAFEDRYSRSAEDPSSAEMLERWIDAWNARGGDGRKQP